MGSLYQTRIRPCLLEVSSILTQFFHDLYLFITWKLILQPDTKFRQRWDYFVMCVVVYNCITLPWFLAFDSQLASQLFVLDILTTLVMALDILFVFRTGFIDHSGLVVFDGGAVAARYVRSWKFWMDVMCTVPFELLLLGGDIQLPWLDQHAWYSILKLNQIIRIHKIINNESLDRHLQLPQLRIFKLFFLWFLFSHFFALFYIFIAHMEGNSPDNTVPTMTWIDDVQLTHGTNFEIYIDALYWALTTMSTVGYGDNHAVTSVERAYISFVLLCSVCFYAIFFGSIATIIQSMQQQFRKHQFEMEANREYAQVNDIPRQLGNKVYEYAQEHWDQNQGFSVSAIMAPLAPSVRSEILLFIHSSLIANVPFFKQCSDRFLESLVIRLKPQVCLPGDYVYKEGDKSREMYFMKKGEVQIEMENPMTGNVETVFTITERNENPFFGEISLLLGERRTSSVRASKKCVFAVLTAEDLFELLSLFPDEESTLRDTALKRLQEDVDRMQPLIMASQALQLRTHGEQDEAALLLERMDKLRMQKSTYQLDDCEPSHSLLAPLTRSTTMSRKPLSDLDMFVHPPAALPTKSAFVHSYQPSVEEFSTIPIVQKNNFIQTPQAHTSDKQTKYSIDVGAPSSISPPLSPSPLVAAKSIDRVRRTTSSIQVTLEAHRKLSLLKDQGAGAGAGVNAVAGSRSPLNLPRGTSSDSPATPQSPANHLAIPSHEHSNSPPSPQHFTHTAFATSSSKRVTQRKHDLVNMLRTNSLIQLGSIMEATPVSSAASPTAASNNTRTPFAHRRQRSIIKEPVPTLVLSSNDFLISTPPGHAAVAPEMSTSTPRSGAPSSSPHAVTTPEQPRSSPHLNSRRATRNLDRDILLERLSTNTTRQLLVDSIVKDNEDSPISHQTPLDADIQTLLHRRRQSRHTLLSLHPDMPGMSLSTMKLSSQPKPTNFWNKLKHTVMPTNNVSQMSKVVEQVMQSNKREHTTPNSSSNSEIHSSGSTAPASAIPRPTGVHLVHTPNNVPSSNPTQSSSNIPSITSQQSHAASLSSLRPNRLPVRSSFPSQSPPRTSSHPLQVNVALSPPAPLRPVSPRSRSRSQSHANSRQRLNVDELLSPTDLLESSSQAPIKGFVYTGSAAGRRSPSLTSPNSSLPPLAVPAPAASRSRSSSFSQSHNARSSTGHLTQSGRDIVQAKHINASSNNNNSNTIHDNRESVTSPTSGIFPPIAPTKKRNISANKPNSLAAAGRRSVGEESSTNKQPK